MTNIDENLMNRYFPVGVFTTYSGYYIYSPTYSPIVVRDPFTSQAAFAGDIDGNTKIYQDNIYDMTQGQTSSDYTTSRATPVLFRKDKYARNEKKIKVTPSKDFETKNAGAVQTIDNSLKKLIPYSVRFDNQKEGREKKDVLVNFTLDNFISMNGELGYGFVNKSGYLLNYDTSVKIEKVDKNTDRVLDVIYITKDGNNDTVTSDFSRIDHLYSYDEYVDRYLEDEIAKYSKADQNNILFKLTVEKHVNEYSLQEEDLLREFIEAGNPGEKEVTFDGRRKAEAYLSPVKYKEGRKKYNEASDILKEAKGEYAYQLQVLDAMRYYVKAANFSNFVYNNLHDLTENDIVVERPEEIEKNYSGYFLKYENKKPVFSKEERIDKHDSEFNNLKQKVIRNSVQYDLINATINYNKLILSKEYEFKLPEITATDWDKITRNISFTAFLNGFRIGPYKQYNNYALATSTQNEFVISPNTLYFTNVTGYNMADDYTFEEANKEGIDLYYYDISSKKFLDSIDPKKHLDNKNVDGRAVAAKMSDWRYDAKYSKELAKYIFDHKNYADFDTVINGQRDSYLSLSDDQKKILDNNLLIGLRCSKAKSF